MTVIVAGTAWAEAPEFGRCIKQAGSKFENSACTKQAIEPTKHKFEWKSGVVNNRFSTKMTSTLATLEQVHPFRVFCHGESSTNGEYTGAKTVGNLVLKFTGCEQGRIFCNSEGKGEREIDTFALEGELGVVKTGTNPPFDNKLGLVLFGPGHGLVAKFYCGGIRHEVRGSVIHPIATNRMLLSATERYAATKGEQKPDKFVGEGVDAHILEDEEGRAPEESGLILTQTLTNEEAVEASSVH